MRRCLPSSHNDSLLVVSIGGNHSRRRIALHTYVTLVEAGESESPQSTPIPSFPLPHSSDRCGNPRFSRFDTAQLHEIILS